MQMVENSLDRLYGEFKTKSRVLMSVVRKKYPGLAPFETWRSRARQAWLYANKGKGPVAKPGFSFHEKGKATDWVFLDKRGQPTWKGDYKYLQYVAIMCGCIGVRGEMCHTQDNGKTIATTMISNSGRYNRSKLAWEQKLLSDVNTAFRAFGYK